MNLSSVLAVSLGGALGSLARYGVSALALPISRELPLGTLIINIVGSFVIGFFGTMTLAQAVFDDAGVCLMASGSVLTDKSIQALKKRGIHAVQIAAPVSDKKKDAMLAASLARLDELFMHSKDSLPNRKLFESLCLYRRETIS